MVSNQRAISGYSLRMELASLRTSLRFSISGFSNFATSGPLSPRRNGSVTVLMFFGSFNAAPQSATARSASTHWMGVSSGPGSAGTK